MKVSCKNKHSWYPEIAGRETCPRCGGEPVPSQPRVFKPYPRGHKLHGINVREIRDEDWKELPCIVGQ